MLTLPFEFTSTPFFHNQPYNSTMAITSSIAVVGVLIEAGADVKILVRCCRAVCGSRGICTPKRQHYDPLLAPLLS